MNKLKLCNQLSTLLLYNVACYVFLGDRLEPDVWQKTQRRCQHHNDPHPVSSCNPLDCLKPPCLILIQRLISSPVTVLLLQIFHLSSPLQHIRIFNYNISNREYFALLYDQLSVHLGQGLQVHLDDLPVVREEPVQLGLHV